MSIILNPDCILCHMRRNVGTARNMGTEDQWEEFTRELLKLYLTVPKEGVSSTWLGPRTEELFRKVYGVSGDRFEEEKRFSNQFVMERLSGIRARVEAAEDPVYAGLQFAVLGNYLDFAALAGKVRFEDLEKMLDAKVYLNLWVKVKENWRDSQRGILNFGYTEE